MWARWVVSEVDRELAEWPSSEGCGQQRRVWLETCSSWCCLGVSTQPSLVQPTDQRPGRRDRLYSQQVRWWHHTGRSGGYTRRLCCLPFSETWTGWRVRQRGTWWSSTKTSAGSCTWGGTTPCTSTGLGQTCWRAALWRGTWVSWWMTG